MKQSSKQKIKKLKNYINVYFRFSTFKTGKKCIFIQFIPLFWSLVLLSHSICERMFTSFFIYFKVNKILRLVCCTKVTLEKLHTSFYPSFFFLFLFPLPNEWGNFSYDKNTDATILCRYYKQRWNVRIIHVEESSMKIFEAKAPIFNSRWR